ncbi:hypothetical protein Dimus_018955, partial [Dionaea muscipula]
PIGDRRGRQVMHFWRWETMAARGEGGDGEVSLSLLVAGEQQGWGMVMILVRGEDGEDERGGGPSAMGGGEPSGDRFLVGRCSSVEQRWKQKV